MSEKKEKDKTKATEADSSGAADIIKELGLVASGSNFKSDIQYINLSLIHISEPTRPY